MKLYRVDIDGEIMVAAESKEQAIEVAERAMRQQTMAVMEDLGVNFASQVTKTADLAAGWDIECYPFGSDRCIKDML